MRLNSKLLFTLFGLAMENLTLGQGKYTVTPVPGPASSSTAYNTASWISNDGSTIYGAVYDTSNKNGQGQTISQCYLATKGKIQVFPTPGFSCAPGGTGGANVRGQFAGVLTGIQLLGSVPTAFANLDGTFNPWGAQLFPLPDSVLASFSTGIDQSGNVVGYAVDTMQNRQFSYLVSGGQVQQIPLNKAAAINNSGAVAGEVVASGVPSAMGFPPNRTPRNAAIYFNGTVVNLGTLGGPSVATNGPESSAVAINNSGQAVGWSTLVPEDFTNPATLMDEGFFYDGTNMNEIQILDGSGNPLSNWAVSLNERGEVVGNFAVSQPAGTSTPFSGPPTHAYVYMNGKATDLNTLLEDAPAGLVLATANYINDRGQILASAQLPDGSTPTFILTPAERHLRTSGQIGVGK